MAFQHKVFAFLTDINESVFVIEKVQLTKISNDFNSNNDIGYKAMTIRRIQWILQR